MKFGKEFKKQKVPEWMETYVDYNGLKRILNEINILIQSNQTSTSSGTFHQRSTAFSGLNSQAKDIEYEVIAVNTVKREEESRKHYSTEILKSPKEGREKDVKFFKKLDNEFNKVNTFYEDKVEEMTKETALLEKQMDALIALRIKVENPDSDETRSLLHISNTGLNKEEDNADRGEPESRLAVLDRVKINNTLESPRSTIKGIFKYSKDEELSFDKNELKKIEDRLKNALIEFYQKLRLLKHYSFMNLSAFSKIMKKYEKITSRSAARTYMKVVDDSYLGSCDEVTSLLEGVEATFITYFSNSNRRAGMKLLKPKHKREKHRITFLSGFFSGCSIALLVAILLLIQTKKVTDKPDGVSYMETIFPLYSLYAYIILHMLLYSANLYFWKRYRVNYPFIFGFKNGTELGYREVFLISTGLSVLAFTSFLVHLHMKMNLTTQAYEKYVELFPLGSLAIILIRTLFELRKRMTWKILSLVSSVSATLFYTYWDTKVDWGLLQRKSKNLFLQRKSKNLFLRDKLVISHKSVYFAAMVMDVILRFAWLQTVLKLNLHNLSGGPASTLFACLEILRRGIWSFFRLENEHLNNVGKYRAFKSVPLPFNYYDDENADDKDD